MGNSSSRQTGSFYAGHRSLAGESVGLFPTKWQIYSIGMEEVEFHYLVRLIRKGEFYEMDIGNYQFQWVGDQVSFFRYDTWVEYCSVKKLELDVECLRTT